MGGANINMDRKTESYSYSATSYRYLTYESKLYYCRVPLTRKAQLSFCFRRVVRVSSTE